MDKMITEEEMWMVYDYITLSIVSDVIEYEVSKIAAAGFKFPAARKLEGNGMWESSRCCQNIGRKY